MKTLFKELNLSEFNPGAFWIWNRYRFLSSNTYCNSLSDAGIYSNCSAKIVHYFENTYPLAHNHWIGILRITKNDGGFHQFFISVAAGKENALEKIQKSALEELIQCGYLESQNNKIDFLSNRLMDFVHNNDRLFDVIENNTKLEIYQPS